MNSDDNRHSLTSYYHNFFGGFIGMIVQRASAYDWAYSEQIPGSRCGPEDGPWPRSYQVLDEADIWNELTVLAKPQTKFFDNGAWKADSINFQPCPRTRTQDRYVVQQLDIHGRMWTLTGVFDGMYSLCRASLHTAN